MGSSGPAAKTAHLDVVQQGAFVHLGLLQRGLGGLQPAFELPRLLLQLLQARRLQPLQLLLQLGAALLLLRQLLLQLQHLRHSTAGALKEGRRLDQQAISRLHFDSRWQG